MFPQHAYSWALEFQYQNIGHRNTRLCPYNVFNVILYIPCIRFLHIAAYRSSSTPSLPPYLSDASTAAAAELATSRSSPSFYHHLLVTHAPGLRTVSS